MSAWLMWAAVYARHLVVLLLRCAVAGEDEWRRRLADFTEHWERRP